MARKTSPISPCKLVVDDRSVCGLQTLPDYHPSNPAHSLTNILQLQDRRLQATARRRQLEIALAAARTEEAQLTREYHDVVVGARLEVVAQYGPDSTAVELVGLTRQSNRKRPARGERDAESK